MKNGIKIGIITFLVIGTLILYFTLPIRELLEPGRLMNLVQTARSTWWTPLILVSMLALGGLAALPASPFTLTIGALYGIKIGFFLNMIGAILGSIIHFLTARHLGRNFVKRITGGKLEKFSDKTAKHGFRVILYLRLVPAIPFFVFNFGAGLSKITFRDYTLASLLGLIPSVFIYTYFASSLLEGAIGAKEKVLHHLIISCLLLLALSLVPLTLKKFTKKQGVSQT